MAEQERFSEEPTQPEIVRWAIAALVCGAVAVLSANVGRFVPTSVINGFQATYHDAASMDQLRTLVTDLRQINGTMATEYRSLINRFNLLDDDSGEMIRRLAAVENSLPLLIESLPVATDIDRSLLTASIAEAGGEVYTVEGGEIVIRTSPLFDDMAEAAPTDQPMPPPLDEMPEAVAINGQQPMANLSLIGIAVGPDVDDEQLVSAYDEIVNAAGPLLLGTAPLLSESGENGRSRILLGPLPDTGSAELLCGRLARVAIECEPTDYDGRVWPL